jgi:hypothetical protein
LTVVDAHRDLVPVGYDTHGTAVAGAASVRRQIEITEPQEVDASYAAYDEAPLDVQDAWGDLASFRDAAGAS